MIKQYFFILILSVFCLSACSKKEEEAESVSEDESPIMSIVNETPPTEPQTSFRNPLDNIVKLDDAAPKQKLTGVIPASKLAGQNIPAAQETPFSNPMDRVIADGDIERIDKDKRAIVTRTAGGRYTAVATISAASLKPQAETGVRVNKNTAVPPNNR